MHEQNFNFAEQVGDDQQLKIHTQTAGISKNGYLYVFVSNETPNINVFFDNPQLSLEYLNKKRAAFLSFRHGEQV